MPGSQRFDDGPACLCVTHVEDGGDDFDTVSLQRRPGLPEALLITGKQGNAGSLRAENFCSAQTDAAGSAADDSEGGAGAIDRFCDTVFQPLLPHFETI